MSSFRASPFSPLHPSHWASPPDAARGHPSEVLDLTAPADRYKLRACLTILHQVHALLRDVQTRPHPQSVPNEYLPYRTLGDDETIVPADITTPRPLRREVAQHPLGATGGRFAEDDLFPSDLDSLADPSDLHEDGRLTALRAVASQAVHDPRFASVQGLLQHVDQVCLEGVDPDNPATSYPTWIAPQIAEVLGLINSMFPTPLRQARDRKAQVEATKFRQKQVLESEREMDARRFEMFLNGRLDEAKHRQNRLQQLGALKGTGAAVDSGVPEGDEEEAQVPVIMSPKRGKKEAPTAAADEDGDDADETHERRRAEKRAANLRTLSPKSRKLFLQKEARTGGARSNDTLKDTTHRPPHAAPFGYSSHKKKKIGDPLDPVSRNTKFDSKPRKAPGLLEPRHKYGVSNSHPKKGEAVLSKPSSPGPYRAQRQPQAEAEEDGEHQHEEAHDDGNESDDPFAVHDTSPPASPKKSRPQSSPTPRKSAARQAEAREEDDDPFGQQEEEKEEQPLERFRPSPLHSDDAADVQPEDDDDDPFAVHDSTPPPRPARRASANLPTPTSIRQLLSSSSGPASPKRLAPSSSRGSLVGTTPALSRGSSLTLTKGRPPSATPRNLSRQSSRRSIASPPTATRGLSRSSTASSDPFASLSHAEADPEATPVDPGTWRDVELKLVAMREELKEHTRGDVQQQVNAALRTLQLDSPSHARDQSGAASESGDMSTLAWDNALHDVLARGKRIIKPDEEETVSVKSPVDPAHAKLEAEKRELETALAELQERDAKHAKSLFLLMEKLGSLNNAPEPVMQQRLGGTRRGLGATTPFAHRPPSAAQSARARQFPLGTMQAHGAATRNLLPTPAEIELEASFEESFVGGLEESIILGPPPRTSALSSEEQTQARLLELQEQLEHAQASNHALRDRLDAATFEAEVQKRTTEVQKQFMATQLVHNSEQERLKEATRAEQATNAHQAALRQIARTERQIQDIRDEQRTVRGKFDADRTALEASVVKLRAEVEEHATAREQHQSEANLMRARLEQIQVEHRSLKSSKQSAPPRSQFSTPSKSGAGGVLLSSDGEAAAGSLDFLALLASSFRGDYLKLRHNVTLSHTITSQAAQAYAQGLQAEDHEEILFTDYCIKYNRRNAGQPRVLVLTSHALYNFRPKSYVLRRRIALRDITRISLSRLCTELVVVHHSTEHDYLLTSPKRPELIFHLQAAIRKLMPAAPTLPFDFSEHLFVRDKQNMMRDVKVIDSQSFKLGKPFEAQDHMV